MAEGDIESTDGTSIKPVSSLRSHFENISITSPAPRSTRTPPKQEARQEQSHGEHQFTERASLDLPRRPSPWSGIVGDTSKSSQQGFNTLGPPVTPRSQRPRSALLHRPASARPPSPPLLTIESPKSPPTFSHRPKVTPPPCPPSPKPKPIGGLGSRPAPPIPPHSPNYTSHSPTKIPAQPPTASKYTDQSPLLARNPSTEKGTDRALANVPPPINRADKPKIPVKPPSSRLGLNSDSKARASDERVSPFSTPPSSDESSTPGLQKNPLVEHAAGSPDIPDMRSHKGLTPPTHYTAQAQQQANSDLAEPKHRHAAGVPRAKDHLEENVESRPGLPPRRMTEKGTQQPMMVQISETRIASMSRLPELKEQGTAHNESTSSQTSKKVKHLQVEFLPPPKRTATTDSLASSNQARRAPSPTRGAKTLRTNTSSASEAGNDPIEAITSIGNTQEYPDASLSNRRPPRIKQGVHELSTGYDTRLFDVCGDCICTSGYLTRAWNLAYGHRVLNLNHGEQTKVTALAFKPGASADDEGQRLWVGTNCGDLMEVDVVSQNVVTSRTGAHNRREIVRIHRHQNAMWTLDDGGNLHVWYPDEVGLPNLQRNPMVHRLPRGHTYSIAVHDRLWVATGKDIRVFQPASSVDESFQLTLQPLNQPTAGEVTSGAIISCQHDRVYFGHSDGKVTLYSMESFSCLGVVNVSAYKINALAGAGDFLWAGFNTGMIYVYDTRTKPWITKKDWHAHSHPVTNILADRSSVWKSGQLQVASIGADNAIRIWDGMLENDWLEQNMQDHDTDYCTFREMSALVVTWNAGAATPGHLRYEEKDTNFFREVLQPENPPDLLVFGFQELVDLEDKKLTAKSLFKGNRKKDPSEQEHVGRQHRAWRDYLVRCIEDSMPSDQPFHLLHTASLVGLFSCVFVRADLRKRIANQSGAEVKRGMGGLHGNKGCLILRFLIDDSSLCLVNCHLAAGQTQTVHRNNDISAILESALLPLERNPSTLCDSYSGGGDGSMILDHEICILNGDLNYRIDTMGRDTVVKAVQAGNFTKLLERDQLLVSRRRNPLFRLRSFTEFPITFAPTYKYDVGTDRYDTSEKHRAPAWCDRILYRGPGKIKQLDYRRHELRASDHRPVSATFKMRIKSVVPERRAQAWQACLKRFEVVREEMAQNAKIIYLRDVLGVHIDEAKTLV